jgi:uncharacterized protein (DUF362 family)
MTAGNTQPADHACTVGISRTGSGIAAGLARALESIGGIEGFISRGDTVLIKPNLNGTEVCTDRAVIDALIAMVRDAGAHKILIGESTFGDARTTDMLFKKTGYTELARKHGVPLVNMNASQAVETAVARPLAAKSLRIAREAVEADAIVNVPVMKVHYATGITLCLKNMKGVLVGDEKRRFHEIGLDKAIVDLNNTIRPALNIIDATTCMERMGPRGGDPVKLDLLIAGASAAETDCVGARIMGYDPSEIRHLRCFMEMSSIDPTGIRVAGESIEACARPFRRVSMENIVPACFTVRDADACSSCMNALLLSCGFLAEGEPIPLELFLGSTVPPGSAADSSGVPSVAFGNCANGMPPSFDAGIRGCPPYPFALKEWLARKRAGGV